MLEITEWFSNNYSGLADKLRIERNQKITSKILKIMENTETVFITIGVGHLLGEDNIIAMLKRKGFSINKIDPAT